MTVMKTPYFLPHFILSYEIQDDKFDHKIVLPLTFNKFIEMQPQKVKNVKPIILSTGFSPINNKIFKNVSQLHEYFSGLT